MFFSRDVVLKTWKKKQFLDEKIFNYLPEYTFNAQIHGYTNRPQPAFLQKQKSKVRFSEKGNGIGFFEQKYFQKSSSFKKINDRFGNPHSRKLEQLFMSRDDDDSGWCFSFVIIIIIIIIIILIIIIIIIIVVIIAIFIVFLLFFNHNNNFL